jgi:UDP-N-acetylmuramate dehydrogenase
MARDLLIREDVVLAPLCSLQLGGAARYFLEAEDEASLLSGIDWAQSYQVPVTLLSGGTNVVIADTGVDGLVIRMALRGVCISDDRTRLTAGAGEALDGLTERTVREGLAGLECLSGIPGWWGGAVVQNAGAYGQEVADAVVSVRVYDRARRTMRELSRAECAFAYRDSIFKRHPADAFITAVTVALRPKGAPTLRYPELMRVLDASSATRPTLCETRRAVLDLRSRKGMLHDPTNRYPGNVGSFFVNPVVSAARADQLVTLALHSGLVSSAEQVPRFPTGDGSVKLSAGWLIEQAGCPKGLRSGHVGISPKHALALVHYGQGTASELIAFARQLRDKVRDRFDITLVPEPVFIGFAPPPFSVV